eukprot:763341-Hanusia_phi.AAC.1
MKLLVSVGASKTSLPEHHGQQNEEEGDTEAGGANVRDEEEVEDDEIAFFANADGPAVFGITWGAGKSNKTFTLLEEEEALMNLVEEMAERRVGVDEGRSMTDT